MKEIWLNCRMGEENSMSSKNIRNPSFLIDPAQAYKVLGFSLKSNLESACSGSHKMHMSPFKGTLTLGQAMY